MRKNHIPALWAFTVLVGFLLVVRKHGGNFTPTQILYALGLGLMAYIYSIIAEWGEGRK